MTRAIRGAVQLEANSTSEMERGVTELLLAILGRNGLLEEQIVSVIFSQTDDLDADNPARCARTLGFASVPLFCTREPSYPGSLPLTVRVLLTAERENWSEPVRHVYLGGARQLRPDLQES
ncbi:MAG: chorismate mutase [Alkalispirochaetaceae bacterium]